MYSVVTSCHAVVTGFCDSAKTLKLLLYKGLKNQIGSCHSCHIEKDKDSIK